MRRRRRIGGAKCYRAWKLWNEGERITGKLVGITEDTYGKPNYSIEIEEMNFEHEPEKEGYMVAEVGKVIGLNSAGSLDSKMQEVEIGDIVEITYEGTDTLPENHKYKNKECHQIDVVVMEGDEDGEVSQEDLSDL